MEVVETRQKRRKPRPGEWWCPVCGVTLRPGELESHLTHELDKLVRLPHTRPLAQRRPPPAVAAHAAHAGPSTSSGRPGTHIWKTFQEVRGKREARGQRRRGGNGAVTCPVCGRILPPDDPELHTHIDDCLRRTEEEDVEVEGVEEYEWCGQTRVRATMMLRAEGQLHALGTKVERGSEDEMVDVCDDDVLAFGPVQYSDADLPDAAHDDPFTPPPPRENHVTSPQPSTSAAHSLGNDVTRAGEEQDDREDDGGAGTMGGGGGGGEGPVVAALRARMRELEAVTPRHGHTCRVCHDVYDKPLVSVLCWHVYCEQCWLSALAAKKLCPQCSGITSASDLRRIYL